MILIPRLILRLSRRAGRDPAARRLQDEREEIAAAEDESIRAGSEPTEVFPIDDDDAREREVDGGTEERGRDGQADEIDEEVIACWVEGVLAQEDSRNVADYFAG
jgi:hypothetical protein